MVSGVGALLLSISEPASPSTSVCSADASAVSRCGSLSKDDIRRVGCNC